MSFCIREDWVSVLPSTGFVWDGFGPGYFCPGVGKRETESPQDFGLPLRDTALWSGVAPSGGESEFVVVWRCCYFYFGTE